MLRESRAMLSALSEQMKVVDQRLREIQASLEELREILELLPEQVSLRVYSDGLRGDLVNYRTAVGTYDRLLEIGYSPTQARDLQLEEFKDRLKSIRETRSVLQTSDSHDAVPLLASALSAETHLALLIGPSDPADCVLRENLERYREAFAAYLGENDGRVLGLIRDLRERRYQALKSLFPDIMPEDSSKALPTELQSFSLSCWGKSASSWRIASQLPGDIYVDRQNGYGRLAPRQGFRWTSGGWVRRDAQILRFPVFDSFSGNETEIAMLEDLTDAGYLQIDEWPSRLRTDLTAIGTTKRVDFLAYSYDVNTASFDILNGDTDALPGGSDDARRDMFAATPRCQNPDTPTRAYLVDSEPRLKRPLTPEEQRASDLLGTTGYELATIAANRELCARSLAFIKNLEDQIVGC